MTDFLKMKCVGCGDAAMEEPLSCGHFYCSACNELLTAHNIVEELAVGNYKGADIEKQICVECKYGMFGAADPQSADEVAEAIRKAMGDWEGYFVEKEMELRKFYVEVEARLGEAEKTGIGRATKEGDTWFEKQKKKVSAVALLSELWTRVRGKGLDGLMLEIEMINKLVAEYVPSVRIRTVGSNVSLKWKYPQSVPIFWELNPAEIKEQIASYPFAPLGDTDYNIVCCNKWIVANSWNKEYGKAAFVIPKDQNAKVIRRVSVGLRTVAAPIFDGNRSVYFIECNGKRIRRMSLKDLSVDAPIPETPNKISDADGFFVGNNLCCIDNFGMYMVYDFEKGEWKVTKCESERRGDTPHPWLPDAVITVFKGCRLCVKNIYDGRILEGFDIDMELMDNCGVAERGSFELVALRAPVNSFHLIVRRRSTGRWKIYSSATEKWSALNLEPRKALTTIMSLDPRDKALLFYARNVGWFTAPLSFKTDRACDFSMEKSPCRICGQQSEFDLSCGHSLCNQCKMEMEAYIVLRNLAEGDYRDQEPQCVLCPECSFNVHGIPSETMMKWDGDDMEVFEKAKGDISRCFDEIRKGIALEQDKNVRFIHDVCEKQRAIEEKKSMALAVLEQEARQFGAKYRAFLQKVRRLARGVLAGKFALTGNFSMTSAKLGTMWFNKRILPENIDVKSWKFQYCTVEGDMDNCDTAIFDPRTGAVIESSWERDRGRTLFVVNGGDANFVGMVEHKDIIKFDVMSRPVFDGKKYMYFYGGKREIVRLTLETMTVEDVEQPPKDFGKTFEGFFSFGSLFCFDANRKAMRYDCALKQWSTTNLVLEGAAMCAHPWNGSQVIELGMDGCVRVKGISDREPVGKETKSGVYRNIGFFLVCNGQDKQPWRMYSSATKGWTETGWPTTQHRTATVFFDQVGMRIQYRLYGENKWVDIQIAD